MNIWILQTGEPLHIDGENARPMRAMNLSNTLIEAGHEVILWSSAFHHQEKRHRSHTAKSIKVSDKLEIRLIPSRGYRRNIGLSRLVDHAQLALNLKKMLTQVEALPDVAFIGFPPIETATVLTSWLKKRGVPTLLDVKDQWPSLFLDAVASPLVRQQSAGRTCAPSRQSGRRGGRSRSCAHAIFGRRYRPGVVPAEGLAIRGGY